MATFYFTFGCGQPFANRFIKFEASDYGVARLKMCERFGQRWAFQYTAEDFSGQPERYGLTELVLCRRCDEDYGRIEEATEDYHGEPICAGCYDSIGESQDARAAEEC